MKKAFLILIILIITISSCERDDICIDPITPNLIIRFYDNDNPTDFKSVSRLSVEIIGVEIDTLILGTSDSIVIPVKVTENMTQYVLTINSNNGANLNRDTITVNYTREDVFVGRSCGYKTIFNNIEVINNTNTNKWILGIQNSETPQHIENETTAHVKIFH